MINRLMMLFVASVDCRRIDQKHTPYLYELTQNYPMVNISNFPEVDLVPTILTGLYPSEHGMCQVKLKNNGMSKATSTIDYIPDIITTTAQCLAHLFSGSFDLASVPPWRRRRFDIYKARYLKRELSTYMNINGFDTFFNVIGKKNSNYIYEHSLSKLNSMVPHLFTKDSKFELAETHGCDTIHHWFSDDDYVMMKAYNEVDAFVKLLHQECQKRGITLLFLSDHGQERVNKSIDIVDKITQLGIKRHEISYYIEASKVRFWFHSQNARDKLLGILSDNSDGTLLHFKDMQKYNLDYKDDSYGEFYFVLNPGTIFFPNDFYHPLGNLFLGFTNEQMRSRLKSPKYRGYHGYLPHNRCEKGTLLLLNDKYKTNSQEIRPIDVAPTILDLLGYDKPPALKGQSAFIC